MRCNLEVVVKSGEEMLENLVGGQTATAKREKQFEDRA